MHSIDTLPGRTIEINGASWRYFSGTAYLGLVQDPAFKELVKEGVDRYGVHYGGSRLAGIRLRLFEAAEALLARLSGAEAGVLLSSGTLAGQLAVRLLQRTGAAFSFAPDVHPALWPEGYRPFAGAFEAWVEHVLDVPPTGPELVLLTNSVDPIRARRYDFDWLGELPRERRIVLVIDDSHSFGICGPDGGGVLPQLRPPAHVDVVVISSLGKAFGIPGGVLFGSRDFIRRVWESPFFGGASPGAPPYLHAFVAGQALIQAARERLRRNVGLLHEALPPGHPLISFDDYPVLYCPDHRLAPYLERHQVLISNFPYPTPRDRAVARIVVNSLHRPEDLESLGALVGRWLTEI
jgi:7-keto-8-aminopelargonate synthetase-like enzyme